MPLTLIKCVVCNEPFILAHDAWDSTCSPDCEKCHYQTLAAGQEYICWDCREEQDV